MAESIKAYPRRMREGFFSAYIQGEGLDIGAGDDPLTRDCDVFEKENPDNGIPLTSGTVFRGDATFVECCNRNHYDWVHASHILEHIDYPFEALRNWFSLVKPGGVLIVAVPHRDLYEKKAYPPSRWNADHKTFWVPYEPDSTNGPLVLGLKDVIDRSLSGFTIEYIKTCNEGHTVIDPNVHSDGEYQIECVIRKG